MKRRAPDYGLEFLLAFDGRIHVLSHGYWLRFRIRRTEPTRIRPHGLSYSFTMHAPDGRRLVGFDNAHEVRRGKKLHHRTGASDHWRRTGRDKGRPHVFIDAETPLADFFREVERVAEEHGIYTSVTRVEEPENQK
jgi:hypothetical protein